MDHEQKRLFRKDIGYHIRGLIWYFLVIYFVTGISAAVLQRGGMDENSTAGTASIISVLIGVGVLFIRNILFDKKADIFKQTKKQMHLNTFAKFFFLVLMLQFLFSTITSFIECVLNAMGFTMEMAVSLASGGYDFSIAMIAYAGVIGPAAEEVVFRGLLLKGFQKYGKVFALIITSVLFGLGHLNPVQMGLAIPMGILLGYIAMEYSIKWAILLHITNNLLLGNVFEWLLDQLPETMSYITYYGCLTAGFVIGIMVLVKERGKLKKWFSDNATPKEYYKWAITQPSVIILCIFAILMNVVMMALSITAF